MNNIFTHFLKRQTACPAPVSEVAIPHERVAALDLNLSKGSMVPFLQLDGPFF